MTLAAKPLDVPASVSSEIVQVVTWSFDGGPFVHPSAVVGHDGIAVEIWRQIAEKLKLAYNVSTITGV